MVNLSFDIGCRSCLQGDGIRHMYKIADDKESDFLSLTDHSVARKIEKWRLDDGYVCEFCNSSNVEVIDVAAGDYMLYKFNGLVRECEETNDNCFMLNIDKRGSQTKSTQGGSKVDKKFTLKSIILAVDYFQTIPQNQFNSHQSGNFLIVVTGKNDPLFKKNKITIQRFRSAGLSSGKIRTD